MTKKTQSQNNTDKNNIEDIIEDDIQINEEERVDESSTNIKKDINTPQNKEKNNLITALENKNKELLYTLSKMQDQINRTAKQHKQEIERNTIKIIEKLNPLINNILLLYQYKDTDPNNLKFPIDLTKKALDDLFTQINTSIINPSPDTPINPAEHEIIDTHGDSNRIKIVKECGIKYKDIVLRPAKIISY